MEIGWNLWHGCHKKSEGCKNCYVFARDKQVGRDANIVFKTKAFNLPILKDRKGNYKYPSGTLFDTCFSSDFFLEDADAFRKEALAIIKERNDCDFFLLTKRPERINNCLNVQDYPNLHIACTCENQKRIEERLPVYLQLPLQEHIIAIEPFLEEIDLNAFSAYKIDMITVGGESGVEARVCDFKWVEKIHDFAKEKGIDFHYHQTGAKLIVNNKLYSIPRNKQHSQAAKAFKD